MSRRLACAIANDASRCRQNIEIKVCFAIVVGRSQSPPPGLPRRHVQRRRQRLSAAYKQRARDVRRPRKAARSTHRGKRTRRAATRRIRGSDALRAVQNGQKRGAARDPLSSADRRHRLGEWRLRGTRREGGRRLDRHDALAFSLQSRRGQRRDCRSARSPIS